MTGPARTSPSSRRWPSGSSCVSSKRTARRRATRCRRPPGSAGTATSRTSSRASATATAFTARGRRRRAAAATRPSCCSTPTPRRSMGRCEWNEAVFAHHFADPENSRNDDDSAPFMPKSVVINPYFDWSNDRLPNIPLHETVIYETARQGLHRAPPGHPARDARHLCRAGAPRGGRVPDRSGRDRRRAAAGPPVRPRFDT